MFINKIIDVFSAVRPVLMGLTGNNYLTAEPYLKINGQPGTVLTGIMQNLRVSLRNPLSRILSCLHFSPL
jgi:hypothetical protein